ncbi:hypothetical protein [Paenibacillus harenae]|uniref:Tail terminator n=1 Tax=Paenibacillus harenae TaxID=306543 RepID=A0ABT9U3Z8_PAEHA|nr:hypothetical protein [Paenibacillus harenae]MDQ0114360.1 hypothetical protein [Paenibacillus harenae]
MTPTLLSKAIKDFIEKLFSDAVTVKPSVYEGYLPKRTVENQDEPDYPFILVRMTKGKQTDDAHAVIVKLIVGVKAIDEAEFLNALNVMDRVRIAFSRQRVLASQFRLELPFEWELFEEQPHPEYLGQAIMNWTLPSVTEEVEGI